MNKKSALSELVWLPNHAGDGDSEEGRIDDFLDYCDDRFVSDWTCKKTAHSGDVYLFWFCSPANVLAGVGISQGEVKTKENDGWDWTDAKKGWFCDYDPLIPLSQPLTHRDIASDRVLARWWKGQPYKGRPKRIVHPSVARRLVELILKKNRNQRLARFLTPFIERKE
jgi:hypothetical protein